MPSSKSYLEFVLEQISELNNVSYRYMMGEYVIYYQKKVIGGIFDDRLLLKPTQSALKIMNESDIPCQMVIPYKNAKEMLVADIDDIDLTCSLIRAIADDLPMPKEKSKLKS